jgi:opacity protein-like surface antigen
MKNLTKTLLAILAAGLVSTALSTHEAQATRIDGTIDFAGSVMFDSPNLANATQVMLWRDVFGNLGFSNVAATTGNFMGIPLGTQATMATPWIFSPSTNTPALWMVGGFTFNLMSATIVDQTAEVLNITGTGIITAAGFEDTAASWAFSTQNAGGDHNFFSFSANAGTGVPDGGSAVALLGMGLGVVEFIRRKLRLRA